MQIRSDMNKTDLLIQSSVAPSAYCRLCPVLTSTLRNDLNRWEETVFRTRDFFIDASVPFWFLTSVQCGKTLLICSSSLSSSEMKYLSIINCKSQRGRPISWSDRWFLLPSLRAFKLLVWGQLVVASAPVSCHSELTVYTQAESTRAVWVGVTGFYSMSMCRAGV